MTRPRLRWQHELSLNYALKHNFFRKSNQIQNRIIFLRVPIVEEESELGSIEQLSQLIKRDENSSEESKVEKMEEDHRFFHALTHPSVIREFLKAYKEL